jgi:hypothetical protein
MALSKFALEDGSLDLDAIAKLRRGFGGGFGFLVPALDDKDATAEHVGSTDPAAADVDVDAASTADNGAADAELATADGDAAPMSVNPSADPSVATATAAPGHVESSRIRRPAVAAVVNGLRVDEALVAVVAARCAAAMKKANLESASALHTAKALADKLAAKRAAAAADLAAAVRATAAGAAASGRGGDGSTEGGADAEAGADEEAEEAIAGLEGLDDAAAAALKHATASAARKEQRRRARAAAKLDEAAGLAPFEAAGPLGTWDGPRAGRYFGRGELGVGYYLDYYPVRLPVTDTARKPCNPARKELP